MRTPIKVCLTLALSFAAWAVGCGTASVSAIQTIPTVKPRAASPLLLTEFMVEQKTTDGPRMLGYVQLYNNSNEALYAADWELVAQYQEGGEFVYELPDGYAVPGNYVVLSASAVVQGETIEPLPEGEEIQPTDAFYLRDKAGIYEPEPVPIAAALSGVRHHRYTSTAGNYTGTRTFPRLRDQARPLNADPLVSIRETFPLAPVEILANPRNCVPGDVDASCRDYVKFYNDTAETVDFTGVRLRVGQAEQSATATNAVALGGTLEPGKYAIFATNANGSALNLTNSGGYVWLEYVHGVLLYENTIVEYPDASSKKGLSWAVDEEGVWRWATPHPGGENNFEIITELTPCDEGQERNPETNRCRKIPVVAEPKPCNPDQERNLETGRCRKIAVPAAPVPCNADQYRHPETNRCRKIETANEPKPCNADQYRNPETGRCKKHETASTPKPCNPDQFRNPETGRCKKVATPTALKPCAAGQERNPDTNRCRKIRPDTSNPGFTAETIEASMDTIASWWALGGVGSLAIGYAGWEWRSEMMRWVRRIKELFMAGK